MFDLEMNHEGESCPICGAKAEYRQCMECGLTGWIIDCGHYDQPRPIADLICQDCFDEKEAPDDRQ